ncbi:MAG: chloride channel protein [Lacunisphaera sp.]
MPIKFTWTDFIKAPRATYQRIKTLTPSRVWEGAGLGLLALAAGGGVMLFHGLTVWIEAHTIEKLAHTSTLMFCVGTLISVLIGSALASWMIARFAPTAGGGGVLPVKLAFWKEFGVMKKREAMVKLLASSVTLGSGVSLGPEGPSIQIGAAIMSTAAGAAGVAKQSRRAWCAAGAAAGLAAVFNAPLAGIAFIMEEVIGDLHSRLLGTVVVAAIVGALVGHAVLGAHPAFQSPPLGDLSAKAWLYVPVVAILAAFGGTWFQKYSSLLRKKIKAGRAGRMAMFRPVYGALITWVAGVSVFLVTGHAGVFGVGYVDITDAMAGKIGLLTAFLLFAGKIVATVGAVGSGGCGGIFAPSLFIGAMAGATVGGLGSLALPLGSGELAMLVMVGMAASLGAVIRTPLTCVLLIFEVTNQWVIVPALMLSILISQIVSRWMSAHDIYEDTMIQDGLDPNQVLPPRHFKRWREIPVSALACFKPVTLASLDPAALKAQLTATAHHFYPVVGDDGRVRGVLARREAELAVEEGHEPRIEPPCWIAAKATVGMARTRMVKDGADFLCVGDEANGVIHGVMTLHDLLRGESVLEDDAGT